jgi:hypothetical protein
MRTRINMARDSDPIPAEMPKTCFAKSTLARGGT